MAEEEDDMQVDTWHQRTADCEHDQNALSHGDLSAVRRHGCAHQLHSGCSTFEPGAPVIVRSVKLHPKEPAIEDDCGCVVLKYQPVAVLVEIDDPNYKNIQLPGDLAPRGHVLLRAVASDKAWNLQVCPKQHVPVIRKQIPLAPRCVLTHYGLQGITAKNGLVAFLSKPSWMKDPDYALAIYVMLSRPRKLDDLWIIDLPPRHMFEQFLHEHNPSLVQRMKEFEQQAKVDEINALAYLSKLQWQRREEIRQMLAQDDLREMT